MKKIIISILLALTMGSSACSYHTQPLSPSSPVKTIKVVDHQVNSKFTYKPPKKKPPKKPKLFILPMQKTKKMIYTNSNNILEN
ncbi:hypothetical protein [Lactobacillus sp. LL6]|uniref:hypothetical protein n=1 Tax=Lactobacillus sp. LL6 TaxID=2596827 RepID=UPI001186DA27|nr:hypothetical protein [Lactobacillus sp. LL6]TSO26236.1 hypothetical protein FOD82_03960 [Lactobacillus sp. LL6]